VPLFGLVERMVMMLGCDGYDVDIQDVWFDVETKLDSND